MPKISIITPIYCDTETKVTWLGEMIQSVINQTIADWELILINDKSPLSLDTVKMKYATETRLRWLENAQNFGPAVTRNTAVRIAESDCILPLDSDDMLANNEVLEFMYDAWLIDKTKTIYGNVQLYRLTDNGFERSKVYQLAHYSFEGAMNLQFGIMPVTTMHSKDAHYKAGGWKSALTHGREDLEYWIACGKAGYCGLKINHTTLLYRKHEQSRDYKLKFELKELETMQRKIKDMHSDIYRGEFPMACCGKGKTASTPNVSVDPTVLSDKNRRVAKITELNDYNENDLEWVAYEGSKKGNFSVLARGPSNLPSSYTILGTGHFFQIHKRHHSIFADRQQLGFRVNQPDPRKQATPKPVEIKQPELPQVIEVPKPELSTLVRLDKPGQEVDVVGSVEWTELDDVGEVIIEPNPPQSYSSIMTTQVHDTREKHSLSELGLSDKLTEVLASKEWTVEDLTTALPQELTSLSGIGAKRASLIIDKAKELINSQ